MSTAPDASSPPTPPASPTPAPVRLHDLIYLDWERVRALAGQLEGVGAAGDGRSGQTAAFARLEAALRGANKLIDVGPDFDYAQWARENFRDGQFVSVTGLIRVLDYPWLASVMETMPRMLKITQRAELSALKQKRDAHQITQTELDAKVKEHQAQLKDLENWKMEELTEVVRELFGQSVRIKVLPYGSKGGEMLVGSCLPGHFFDPPALLSQNYGCDINAAWTVVGVLNTAPPAPAPPLPTGNAVEDMFERLALAVNRIHRVASAPDFPAMSVTPLAIYRTL
jgi:hypothetical protein